LRDSKSPVGDFARLCRKHRPEKFAKVDFVRIPTIVPTKCCALHE
jgi:hypothetical protein